MRLNRTILSMISAVGAGNIAPSAASAATFTFATSSCSINTAGWCLGGSSMTQFLGAITNSANFGPGGTVGTSVVVNQLNTVNAGTLAGANGFISTWWSDSESATSVSSVVNFFLGGGALVLFQDDSGHDAIGEALGLPTYGSDGSPSNGGSPLFNGPFGVASNVNQYGNTGYLNSADIAAHSGTIGGLNGGGQATAAYWAPGQYAAGAGALVVVGDVDMVANYYSSPYSPNTNANGTFGLNTIAYAINGAPVGGVPEPATWGLMIAGFGGVGAVLRRRRPSVIATA